MHRLMLTKLGNLFIWLEPRSPEQVYGLCEQLPLPLSESEIEKFVEELKLLPYELDAMIAIKMIHEFLDTNHFVNIYSNTNIENFYEVYELILITTKIEEHYTLAGHDKAIWPYETKLIGLAQEGHNHKKASAAGLNNRWSKSRQLYDKAIMIAKEKWECGCDFKHHRMKDWLLNEYEEDGRMPFLDLREAPLMDKLKSLLREMGRADLIFNGFK